MLLASLALLLALHPGSVTFGSGSFLFTALGDAFRPQSVINFNGTPLTTTFVSATSLTAVASSAGAPCGGRGNHGQTYVITITGTSGNYQHLTSVQLVVD